MANFLLHLSFRQPTEKFELSFKDSNTLLISLVGGSGVPGQSSGSGHGNGLLTGITDSPIKIGSSDISEADGIGIELDKTGPIYRITTGGNGDLLIQEDRAIQANYPLSHSIDSGKSKMTMIAGPNSLVLRFENSGRMVSQKLDTVNASVFIKLNGSTVEFYTQRGAGGSVKKSI